MPFNNYSELFQEIVDLVARGSIRPKVPGWVSLAETEAVQEIRNLREVRYKTTGTLVADNEELTLIDGIHGIDVLQLDESPIRVVKAASIAQVVQRRALEASASDTHPVVYAWTGPNTIELAPTPQAATAYTLYYTGAMGQANETKYTSNILEEAPNYLLYRAAFHFALYTRNAENEARWGGAAASARTTYAKFLARKDKKTIQVGAPITPPDYPQTTGSF